jgi:hypothetical protein
MNDPYAKSRADLDTLVGVPISVAENAWQAGSYSATVAAYQQAGQAGSTIVGPEIDAVGYPNVTQNFTQQAWQLNSLLAAIAPTSATQTQALEAAAFAQKMLALYQRAIDAGTEAANPSSETPTLLIAAGIAIAVGLAIGVVDLMHKKSSVRASQAPTRRLSSRPRTSRAVTRRYSTR